jgi:hypothetical protein
VRSSSKFCGVSDLASCAFMACRRVRTPSRYSRVLMPSRRQFATNEEKCPLYGVMAFLCGTS